MTKQLILLTVFLLSLVCVSASQSYCMETDGGNVSTAPGQMFFSINGNSGIVSDFCRDSSTLHERYCQSNSYPARGADVFCELGCMTNEKGIGYCFSNETQSNSGEFGSNAFVPLGPVHELVNLNLEQAEDYVCEDCENEVPEFSVMASGVAFAFASFIYIVLRKRN